EYELRYRFRIGSRDYTASDSFGRHDLWEEVPENDWQVAKVTGRIAIFYLPEDPDVSCPVARAPGAMPLGDAIAGFAVFAFFALIGLAGWVVFATRLRAAMVRRRIGVDSDHFLFG